MLNPANSWTDHGAVLFALRALGRLRDYLISLVLSVSLSIGVYVVVISMLTDVPVGEGFARTGRFIVSLFPDWVVRAVMLLGILAALAAVAMLGLLLWRGFRSLSGR
jgi:hypothetical protein